MSKGRVVTITGPVVDIEFERGQLPEILNAIKIERNDNGVLSTMTVEAAVHLGDNLVRSYRNVLNRRTCAWSSS